MKTRPARNVEIARQFKVAKRWKAEALGISIECGVCGYQPPVRNEVSMLDAHHIFPLGRGGEDTRKKLALLCPNCHRLAHYFFPKADLNTVFPETEEELCCILKSKISGCSTRLEHSRCAVEKFFDRSAKVTQNRCERSSQEESIQEAIVRLANQSKLEIKNKPEMVVVSPEMISITDAARVIDILVNYLFGLMGKYGVKGIRTSTRGRVYAFRQDLITMFGEMKGSTNEAERWIANNRAEKIAKLKNHVA